MRLGIIIKNYRAVNRLSMDDFARRTGLSKAYIGMLEKGIHPKTGKVIRPSVETIQKAARGMNLSFSDLFNMLDEEITLNPTEDETGLLSTGSVRIPVLGSVPADHPISAVRDILAYEEISESMAMQGDYFGLVINGNSMEPLIMNGDTVIVLKQENAENGNIVIASIGDDEAVCKKYISEQGATLLRSLNPAYKDINVTGNPTFCIYGIVAELRRCLL